jgi:hypothetical protein
VGRRTELSLLVLLVVVIGAFIVSFVLGWKPGGAVTPGPVERTAGSSIPLDSIHVEVLNASGREGLAKAATERLRGAGIDVVYFGNAARTRDATVVLDRVGRRVYARAVADALGIADVRTELDSTRFVEVSVILGRNWTSRR